MIWRKEPLFRKMLIILVISLIVITSMSVLSNLYLISQMDKGGVMLTPGMVYNQVLGNAVFMLLVIVLNIVLFRLILRYMLNKLEVISLAIDRIMDGDFSVINDEGGTSEGILSRLESQFAQMSRRIQLSLENMDKEKENIKSLVTDISHQIKTPLASIKVFNSLLLEEDISAHEQNEFLNSITKEVDKMEWLSTSLLKISRLEAGMMQLQKEPQDIKQTILEAVNGVYLRALEKDIEINMYGLESIVINHDRQWTKEALFNVLENAVKYTPVRGEVKVSLEKLETYIKVDIKDNGIGIGQQEIGHVFDRFYRGEAEIIKNTEGSGIGLYLSRKILEEQDGGIVVSSEEGQGTQFTILLPYRTVR